MIATTLIDLRVLVCGGRYYDNRTRVFQVLDYYHNERGIKRVIEGGASGADKLAGEWALSREVDCVICPAQWKKHGNAAGPIRNQRMLDKYKPDLVLAFPGGRGTAHMVSIAREAGVPVYEVDKV